ncbi:uncharacterized protein LOC128394243 [Panonychus citri]|uniref:uncharacterized protein LOC128394243 n=1 Tax=Panonychus citri TaxID=50023 RepID=UPI0023073B55|nr:uncharacterized protein LOC128394243 [Panonychus citri]
MQLSTMNINDLPDDCLLLIFDHFYQLRQFATFMKVCRRWKILVEKRLKKITHFDVTLATRLRRIDHSLEQNNLLLARKCIITISRKFLMKIKLSKLFPNVKIIHLENYAQNCLCSALVHLLSKANQIKGLSVELESRLKNYSRYDKSHECKILKREEKRLTSFLSDIEFLGISNDLIVTSYLRTFGHLKKLKSLGSSNYFYPVNSLHVLKFAQFLTNLERLVAFCNDESDDFVCVQDQLPIFNNILHLRLESISNDGSTFTKFLNLCPNLINLSLSVYFAKIDQIRQINRNFNVQRLDLQFYAQDQEKMLTTTEKFPNCRYLSICSSCLLPSQDLIQIISTLPHLSLLHVKNDCTDLAKTQIIKNYCHSQNPKIDVYFGYSNKELMMSNELYRKFDNPFLHK